MFADIINQIKEKQPEILIIGDLMLDKFIFGNVERISPEAPVPIVKLQNEKHMLGGCGNVIRNLNNLGAKASLVSVAGQDLAGDLLIEQLLKKDISVSNVLRLESIRTTEKMRIVADRQQVARVDWDMDDFEIEHYNTLLKSVATTIKDIGGIIISDYEKGVCSELLIKEVMKLSKENKVPVYVDPKGNNWDKYKYASLITPNTIEVESILGDKLILDKDFEVAGGKICDIYNIDACLITRGSDGMSYVSKKNIFHLRSEAQEIFDVSGAGDTVISAMVTGLAIDLTSNEAAEFSNQAAGIVVGHIGTSAITTQELLDLN